MGLSEQGVELHTQTQTNIMTILQLIISTTLGLIYDLIHSNESALYPERLCASLMLSQTLAAL